LYLRLFRNAAGCINRNDEAGPRMSDDVTRQTCASQLYELLGYEFLRRERLRALLRIIRARRAEGDRGVKRGMKTLPISSSTATELLFVC
jgi:hypothetical protein